MKSTLKLYILDLDKFLIDKTKPSLGLSHYNVKKKEEVMMGLNM